MGRLRVDRVCRQRGRILVGDRTLLAPCHIADRWWSRLVGLLGTARLQQGEAIWIEPCRSVHTAGMRMSIAVAFVDRHGHVVRLADPVRPWRLVRGGRDARAAVEAAPGAFADVGVGSRLRLEPDTLSGR